MKTTVHLHLHGEKVRAYSEEIDGERTILDLLELIRTGQAPDLLYRHSCHHGSCGTCTLVINGKEQLACTTQVKDAADEQGTIHLAPLKDMKVLGGLAVVPETFNYIEPEWTYLRTIESGPSSSREISEETDLLADRPLLRFENCIECGACLSACPVIGNPEKPEFAGPAALAALRREAENRPEKEEGLIEKSNSTLWAWGCDREIACSRVCPAGVAPAKKIQELRNASRRSDEG